MVEHSACNRVRIQASTRQSPCYEQISHNCSAPPMLLYGHECTFHTLEGSWYRIDLYCTVYLLTNAKQNLKVCVLQLIVSMHLRWSNLCVSQLLGYLSKISNFSLNNCAILICMVLTHQNNFANRNKRRKIDE